MEQNSFFNFRFFTLPTAKGDTLQKREALTLSSRNFGILGARDVNGRIAGEGRNACVKPQGCCTRTCITVRLQALHPAMAGKAVRPGIRSCCGC